MDLPIIYGPGLKPNSPEAVESVKYETGAAEADARSVAGRHEEPWMNVLEKYEPGSPPAVDFALRHPVFGARIQGKIIDFGAGTCWVTSRLSSLPAVKEVVALDLSEVFFRTAGVRMIRHWKGDPSKIRFAVASFNQVPVEDGYFDCGFFVASLHHSTAPILSLLEARRVLKPGGLLVLVEIAISIRQIDAARTQALLETRTTNDTEMRYTKGEWKYMLEHARFKNIEFHVVDALTRNPAVLLVRKLLRKFDLERVIFTNLVVITAQT